MKFKSEHLISELVELTRQNLNVAENLSQMKVEILNAKTSPDSWSALECIEHLNRYGDFYIPEITTRIKQRKLKEKNTGSIKSDLFKSGKLGNYFSNTMKFKENLNAMKTLKSMNPAGSNLAVGVVDKFIDQQKSILDLLNSARDISLTRTKTSISISKLIKLRLGDTFRVVIYHNERHLIQATKAAQNGTR